MELHGLELKPWHDLRREVGRLQPTILIGEDELPEKTDHDEQQDSRAGEGPRDGVKEKTVLQAGLRSSLRRRHLTELVLMSSVPNFSISIPPRCSRTPRKT